MKTRSSERLHDSSQPAQQPASQAVDTDAALHSQEEGMKVRAAFPTNITVASKSPQHQHSHTNPTPSPADRPAVPEHVHNQRNRSRTASPTKSAVSLHAEDVPYPAHRGRASPVQLTELVPSGGHKTYSPPSDRNHNVTSMYLVLPSGTSHLSLGYEDGAEAVNSERYTEKYVDRVAALTGDYSADRYGEQAELPSSEAYAAPAAAEQNVYHTDSPYQFTFPAGVCKNYSFSTAGTTGEYSSPEMAPCTRSDDSAYTVTASNASCGSPEPIRWSPEGRSVNSARETYVPPASVGQNGRLQETVHDTQSYLSGNSSSAHTAYYSDEQSLEGDSMRDIQQEILRADIQRHIYESYSQSLNVYEPDEACHRETENVSPANSSAERKSSSGSKKRRRRMQTPVQRKAANMRERKRMCHLNVAFDHLKDRLPNVRSRKKLSRIQTLRAAIFYISLLSECLQSS